MTDHDPEEIRERARRILEETAGVEAAMRERAEKNPFQAPYRRETGSATYHSAPIETPVRRPSSVPRDYPAEAAYFTACAEQMVEQKIEALLAGVGQALARMRTQLRDQMRAEVTAVIEELRKELVSAERAAVGEQLAALGAGISRVERMLDHYSRAGAIELRPN